MSLENTKMSEALHTSNARSADPEGHRTVAAAAVFFDGGCPLCRREIDHYRRLRGAERLQWIDIANDDQALARHGLHRTLAMARFHVLDRNGAWQTGAWGFAELWSHLPAYRWLASLVRTLGLLPSLGWAYRRFAAWRLRRRCDTDTCRAART